jgi:hypothetical protein
MHQHLKGYLRSIGMLAAALLLALPVAAAAERLTALPPEVHLRFGAARLAGYITDRPECREVLRARTPHPVCTHGSPFAARRYYAVWLVTPTEQGGAPRELHRRLLLLPLR